MLKHLFALEASELDPKRLEHIVCLRLADMGYSHSVKDSGVNDVYVKKHPNLDLHSRAVVLRGGEHKHVIPSDHVQFFEERPTFSGGEYAYLGRYDLVKQETVAEFVAKPHPHPLRSGLKHLAIGFFVRLGV